MIYATSYWKEVCLESWQWWDSGIEMITIYDFVYLYIFPNFSHIFWHFHVCPTIKKLIKNFLWNSSLFYWDWYFFLSETSILTWFCNNWILRNILQFLKKNLFEVCFLWTSCKNCWCWQNPTLFQLLG